MYLASALLGLLLFPLYFALSVLLMGDPQGLAGTVGLISWMLYPAIFCSALTWVAMWYHWFTFYKAGWVRKSVWAAVLFLFSYIGAPVYYFFGYRPDIRRQLGE